MPEKLSIFIVSTPNIELAKTISKVLITDLLAACVNLIPNITSVYRWNGEVQEDPECLMLIKSKSSNMDEITRVVKQHHSYDVPEIIQVTIEDAEKAYGKWIRDSIK